MLLANVNLLAIHEIIYPVNFWSDQGIDLVSLVLRNEFNRWESSTLIPILAGRTKELS